MATTRVTFSLDRALASRAHDLGIDVSAAARQGVVEAVRRALLTSDREEYGASREGVDEFWSGAEAWGEA
jgi:post-segregation antitoxin (ccd killing protein)